MTRVVEIIADLHVDDIESAREFYASYLGLSTEEFNLGWVARFSSPDTKMKVQVVTSDATAPEDPVVSIKFADVDVAYEDAQRRGYEIVHPLSTESWGVRRFFVRAPDGNVLNIVQHHGWGLNREESDGPRLAGRRHRSGIRLRVSRCRFKHQAQRRPSEQADCSKSSRRVATVA